jgi:ribose/xylose/arabinose/galactoside ABC-type transport system permease subunit
MSNNAAGSRRGGKLTADWSLSRIRATVLARSRADSLTEILFVPVVLVILATYLAITNEFFLTTINLKNLFVQAAILAIVAFGVTFVILAAELDLSVGSGVALVSVVAALVMQSSDSVPLGLLAGLGTGIAIGAINGLVVTAIQVPSFIATFGMLVIAHGVALMLSGGGVVAPLPEGVGDLTKAEILGAPVIVVTMFVVFAILLFVQNQTVFGVQVFAVGGNREAARLAGVRVDRVRFYCFVLTGVVVGIGGLALMSRVESGQPNAGDLLALEAIAAIVVGGNSIFGGRGSVTRTLMGVLLITLIRNGMDLEGVDADVKQVIIGVVFIAAASTDFVRGRLTRRSRAQHAVPAEPREAVQTR